METDPSPSCSITIAGPPPPSMRSYSTRPPAISMNGIGGDQPRSLKRWIFPVAVMGSSVLKSTHRGHL